MSIPTITDGELGSDVRTLSLNPVITAVNALGTASTKNVGTAANDVVQLDGSAKLPAVDGSQLTNLPSGGGGSSITTTLTAGSAVAAGTVVSMANDGSGNGVQTWGPALDLENVITLLPGAADSSSGNPPVALKLDADHFVAFVPGNEFAPYASAVAGTIDTASNPPITIGTPNTSDAGLIAPEAAVALDGSTLMVLYSGNIEVMTVSGNAFSAINSISFPDSTAWLQAVALSSTLVAALYVDGSNNLSVVAISVSGTTPAAGTGVVLGGAATSAPYPLYQTIAKITSTSFLAVFSDAGNSHAMTACAGAIVGTVTTLGTPAASAIGYFVSQVKILSSTEFAVSFVDKSNSLGAVTIGGGTIAGTVVAWGGSPIKIAGGCGPSVAGPIQIGPLDQVIFGSFFLPQFSVTFDSSHVGFFFYGSYPAVYSYSLGNPTGPTNLTPLPVGPLSYGLSGFGVGFPNLVTSAIPFNATTALAATGTNQLFEFDVSGNVSSFASVPTGWGLTVFPVDSTHALLLFADPVNNVNATIVGYGAISNGPIGLTAAGASNGDPLTVVTGGECPGFTSLTPGAPYYANGDGTLTHGNTGHHIGKAKNPTTMIVTGVQ